LLKIWSILDEFKEYCKLKAWNIHEKEDIIEAENECHRFIWTKYLYPNTFKRVVTHRLYLIHEGIYSKKVRISYMAWLLLENPPIPVRRMINEMPGITKRVAIYDVSPTLTGRHECQKLNETNSVVFAEFEQFLKTEYGMKFKPIKK